MKRTFLIAFASLVALAAYALETEQTYRIVSKRFPTKSLFVKDSQRESDIDIVLWTETNVPSQQWRLTTSSNGQYVLQNVYSE